MIEPEVKAKKRRGLLGLQVGLRQLMLAMLCAGAWLAHWTNRDGIARLESRLSNLQTLSPELVVLDPARTAVVQLPSPWFSTNRWGVFVPTDKVRLCVATEDIDHFGFPVKYESILLPKGQYEVQLEEQQVNGSHRFIVTQNGQACLQIEEQFRIASRGHSTNSDVSSRSTQFDQHVPIVLTRRRNSVPVPNSPGSSQTPTGPAEGLLLWLQNDR